MKKKTRKSIFTKLTSAVLSFALLITATVGLTTIKASAASARILTDENATVQINADGSGSMTLNKTFDKKHPLTEVAGVPLSEIITFNDGGYIDQFYQETSTGFNGDGGDVITAIYPHTVRVHGRGPSGFFSGSGYLHFTDKTDDTYNLSLFSSITRWHYVRFDSDSSDIVKIAWNS